jgi:hypothetical protein
MSVSSSGFLIVRLNNTNCASIDTVWAIGTSGQGGRESRKPLIKHMSSKEGVTFSIDMHLVAITTSTSLGESLWAVGGLDPQGGATRRKPLTGHRKRRKHCLVTNRRTRP